MVDAVYLVLASKFNELCGCGNDNLIYSLVPSIDSKPEHMRNIYAHNLSNLPLVIDSALSVFCGKRTDAARKSYPFIRLSEEKDNLWGALAVSKNVIGLGGIKASDDSISAALAALSRIYLDSFFYPIQFFLPQSSVCSGQWDMWDKVDYLKLVEKIHQKEAADALSKRLLKSDVWKVKFKADDFAEIVKRRLLKEKLLDKKLNPESMIKAIIIRMGELAKPSINYEVIDFSIRSFFTYLDVKHYLRIDREMMFLRVFEEEFAKILSSVC